jgi:dienelactone hydrolase
MTGTGPYRVPFGIAHEVVTVRCTDEYALSADSMRRQRLRGRVPGVLFLHDRLQERHQWYPLTIQCAGRGLAVLAPDLRGHGENPDYVSNPPLKAAGLTASDYQMMLDDVRNAVSSLAIRDDVEGGKIAILGFGTGANLALLAAAEPWAEAIRCVVAVSPRPDDHGLRPETAITRIPASRAVYLAAAADDPESLAACGAWLPRIRGVKEFHRAETGGRGKALLGTGLFQKIPTWLFAALQPEPQPAGGRAPVRNPGRHGTR